MTETANRGTNYWRDLGGVRILKNRIFGSLRNPREGGFVIIKFLFEALRQYGSTVSAEA
jgi:hypothetical protein